MSEQHWKSWARTPEYWNTAMDRLQGALPVAMLGQSHDHLLKRVEESIAGKTNLVALDNGCGRGPLAFKLAAHSGVIGQTIAADCASRALEIVQESSREKGVTSIETLLSPGENLKLDNESVDVAVASYSIIFSQDIPGCIRELYRVLRPGGIAFVTSWTLQAPLRVLFDAFDAFNAEEGSQVYYTDISKISMVSLHDVESSTKMFEEAGFSGTGGSVSAEDIDCYWKAKRDDAIKEFSPWLNTLVTDPAHMPALTKHVEAELEKRKNEEGDCVIHAKARLYVLRKN